MPLKSEPVTLWVLVLPQMLMLDMVGPAEVFNFANRYAPESFELKFFGPSSPVVSGMGLSVNVAAMPERIPANSWLLIPGLEGLNLDFSTPLMREVVDWLDCYQAFDKVISVCSGALLLGHADLLQSRACTTHHSHLEELQRVSPCASVQDNRLFVQDENLYTSAGVTAGIDLALYMVEQHCGVRCAAEIARSLVLFSRRGGREPASSVWLTCRNHLDTKVHRVQDVIQADPAKDWR
ncbi:MAG: GlxA family transcriptional regulator, partial [Pseudomonadales bacterium]